MPGHFYCSRPSIVDGHHEHLQGSNKMALRHVTNWFAFVRLMLDLIGAPTTQAPTPSSLGSRVVRSSSQEANNSAEQQVKHIDVRKLLAPLNILGFSEPRTH